MFEGRDIIFLAPRVWETHWGSGHHIMSRLSERNRVLFVEAPVTPLTPLFSPSSNFGRQVRYWLQRRIRHWQHNLYILTPPPLLALRFFRWSGVLSYRILMRHALATAIRQLGFRDHLLWTMDPFVWPLIGMLGESFSIYHCADNWAGSFPDIMGRWIERAENELLRKVDLVLTSARSLCQAKKHLNPNTYFLHSGVDYESYSRAALQPTIAAPDIDQVRRPIIGFMGVINERIDVDLMCHVAQSHSDWSVVFVGPIRQRYVDVSPLKRLPNVYFVGMKQVHELPLYVNTFSVCLIPYKINRFTECIFPLKVYEYLAAGKPVVSTNLPELRGEEDVVWLAKDERSFVQAVEHALREDSPAEQARRMERAAKNDWSARMDMLYQILEQHLT